MPHIEFLADRREAGKTVSAVLRSRFGLTWSQAQRLIERGHVRVAGFACSDPAHRVKNGNRIWLREGTVESKIAPARQQVAPTDKPVKKKLAPPEQQYQSKPLPARSQQVLSQSAIVFADDSIVVVNKPAGLTTSRSDEDKAEFGEHGRRFLPKTVADLLPEVLRDYGTPVIPVHRLDRDTSGLVVFARNSASAANLTEQFRKHAVERRYLALVRGAPLDGRIESKFVPDRGDGRRGSGPGGKLAVTRVKVLERFPEYSLVACRLETGRTHQVRIHLGEKQTPLCGERVYDRKLNGPPFPDGSGARRPMLHAARLGLKHPETGERVQWEVSPPADFQSLLTKFRRNDAEAWDL